MQISVKVSMVNRKYITVSISNDQFIELFDDANKTGWLEMTNEQGHAILINKDNINTITIINND